MGSLLSFHVLPPLHFRFSPLLCPDLSPSRLPKPQTPKFQKLKLVSPCCFPQISTRSLLLSFHVSPSPCFRFYPILYPNILSLGLLKLQTPKFRNLTCFHHENLLFVFRGFDRPRILAYTSDFQTPK
jgi:hypothetical protein